MNMVQANAIEDEAAEQSPNLAPCPICGSPAIYEPASGFCLAGASCSGQNDPRCILQSGSQDETNRHVTADMWPKVIAKKSGWQPIETAPKDGTYVLLAGGPLDQGFEECPPMVVALWKNGSWMYAAWDADWRSEYSEPTHWMPLPPPPSSVDRKPEA